MKVLGRNPSNVGRGVNSSWVGKVHGRCGKDSSRTNNGEIEINSQPNLMYLNPAGNISIQHIHKWDYTALHLHGSDRCSNKPPEHVRRRPEMKMS